MMIYLYVSQVFIVRVVDNSISGKSENEILMNKVVEED